LESVSTKTKVPYILYVDDDPDDCTLFEEALTRYKSMVPIKCINSGNDSVRFLSAAIIKDELPGVVILDVNMPGMDGRATLIALKKILPSETPVIFLTTTPRNTDISFGDRSGATLFAKPTSIAGYNDLINTILNVFF
jgi:two-component system, response regulator